MPPLRTRKSSISSKVTLYSSPSTPPPPHQLPSTPLRRSTRSSTTTTPLFDAATDSDTSIKDEEEDDIKPVVRPKPTRKPTPRKMALDIPHPAPKNWEKQYAIIEEQRKSIVAPVDLMGCEQGGIDQVSGEERKPFKLSWKDKKLSTLVSLMLSSQTKDPVTHQATQNLRYNLPIPGLTLESIEQATVQEIDECIKKVGFHNTKAANLKLMAAHLREKHQGEVPEDLDALLEIKGCGPKMAYLALSSYGQNLGIGVDTHVHRITHRLRWHRKEPKNAEETRLNLESWLPKDRWPTVNKMLVGFGQEICRPVGPRCDQCSLGAAKLCPSRRTVPASSSPRKKAKLEVKEEFEVKGEEGGEPKVEIGLEVDVKLELEEGGGRVEEEIVERVKVEIV